MKTTAKLFPGILSMFAIVIAFSTASALADQNRGRGGHHGDEDDQHLLEIELSMMPTADAPAGSSARVSLEAENENGMTAGELEVKTRNLPAGNYSVTATLKSDGSTVVLGTLTVDNEGEGELELGHEGNALPANFDPADVDSVAITAVNGVVLFTADLSGLTTANTMNISVAQAAVAGSGVPNATGNLTITGFLSHGRVKGSLQFIGHGLPANTQVVITINGIPAKNLHTSKTGDVRVNLGPKGKTGTIVPGITLAGITSVALVDRNGNILLQVNL
jgi:hypothetical protein